MRYETYDDKRASFVGLNPPGSGSQFPYLREGDNDFLALSSNVPISAAQTIYAAYVETSLPFVTRENRRPLLESLELTLAGRFEHFSIFGQTTKPKASLVWKPFSFLKMRASAAESFRAPNLVQTNTTPLRRQIGADDGYRFDVTGLLSDGTAQRTVYRQGNQNLQPEEAKTWVAGLVLDVPKVRGLSFSFDYFHLNQNQVIENVGGQAAIDRDELTLALATQAELAKGTNINQIDLGSGSLLSLLGIATKDMTEAHGPTEDEDANKRVNARKNRSAAAAIVAAGDARVAKAWRRFRAEQTATVRRAKLP